MKSTAKSEINGFRQNKNEVKRPLKPYSIIFKNPIIISSCAGLFFYLGIFSVLSTWLTAYFQSLGVDISYGSLILSGFWAFNAFGVIIAGKLLLKTNETSLLLLFSIFGAVSSVLYSAIPLIYIKIVFLVMQAILYSGFFPLLNAIAVKEDPDLSGSILGITISVSVLSQIIFQPLTGFILQNSGLNGINILLVVCAAALFISTFSLFKVSSKKHGICFKLPYSK